ncbi:MAG: pyrroline-5-carboxylate reductase [Candidatus Niameybacter stercoravium]|nr:pyrroline-5-carboxylate reductase [Candidatus Niameybacter stercoravium]
MNNFGFIGAGNMGSAMINAIARKFEETICVYDVDSRQYEKFIENNICKCEDIKTLVEQSTYIVLTIKPQYYKGVCEQIKDLLTPEHVIITVAPGFSIEEVENLLNGHKKVVRTMPNTPALVGEGVTALCYDGQLIKGNEAEVIEERFGAFGKSFKVEEHQMNAIVALSGSSPAYGYLFIEAMADAAVKFGIPRSMAYEMAARSIKGACEMVIETKEHPGALKDAVTSPGGTTIEAVAKLEETGFRHSVISGMTACYEKAEKMSQKK